MVKSSYRGIELWQVPSGTSPARRFAEIAAGTPSSDPMQLTAASIGLFFTATTAGVGRELWVTDGVYEDVTPPALPAGTRQVMDINPGTAGSDPDQVVEAAGRVFFVANDGEHGRELWVTSGSAIGGGSVTASRLSDLVPASGDGAIEHMTSAGTRLYFIATTPDAGRQLWVSDGTSGGTSRVSGFDALAGRAYFRATTPAFGTELWTSHGSASGTELLADLRPGDQSSAPRQFTLAGDRLFFTADDGEHGEELFVLRARGACAADFDLSGDLTPDDLADYITAYFTQPPGFGTDVNDSGATDPDDLAEFVAAFFGGCS